MVWLDMWRNSAQSAGDGGGVGGIWLENKPDGGIK